MGKKTHILAPLTDLVGKCTTKSGQKRKCSEKKEFV